MVDNKQQLIHDEYTASPVPRRLPQMIRMPHNIDPDTYANRHPLTMALIARILMIVTAVNVCAAVVVALIKAKTLIIFADFGHLQQHGWDEFVALLIPFTTIMVPTAVVSALITMTLMSRWTHVRPSTLQPSAFRGSLGNLRTVF